MVTMRYMVQMYLVMLLGSLYRIDFTNAEKKGADQKVGSEMQPFDEDAEFYDEAMLVGPMDSLDVLESEGVPEEISAIDQMSHLYTAEGNAKNPDKDVIQPQLLANAEQAMIYVRRVYNQIEKHSHMFSGKGLELLTIQERYTSILSGMLSDKTGLKHLNFIRRYLNHVSKSNSHMISAEARRSELVSESQSIYKVACDKHSSIKLDFERHYTTPQNVITTAVTSLIGLGEAYKRLVHLNNEIFQATNELRIALNRVRATSVYMFSYSLCLDILFTEILPLRTLAVQDVMGTKTTGDVLAGYHTNITNRKSAIKSLTKLAQLTDDERKSLEEIYQEVKEIELRADWIQKSTSNIVSHSDKDTVTLIHKKIGKVVDVWNQQYRRPIVMSARLVVEYSNLRKLVKKIEVREGQVHRNKQALYTMSIHCDELYQKARKLAKLPTNESTKGDGISGTDQGTGASQDTTSDAKGNLRPTGFRETVTTEKKKTKTTSRTGGSGSKATSSGFSFWNTTPAADESENVYDEMYDQEDERTPLIPQSGLTPGSSRSVLEKNKSSPNRNDAGSLLPPGMGRRWGSQDSLDGSVSSNSSIGSNESHYDPFEHLKKFDYSVHGDGHYRVPSPDQMSDDDSDTSYKVYDAQKSGIRRYASESNVESLGDDMEAVFNVHNKEPYYYIIDEGASNKRGVKRPLEVDEQYRHHKDLKIGAKIAQILPYDEHDIEQLLALLYKVQRISDELIDHHEDLMRLYNLNDDSDANLIVKMIITEITEICKTYRTVTCAAVPQPVKEPVPEATPSPREASSSIS